MKTELKGRVDAFSFLFAMQLAIWLQTHFEIVEDGLLIGFRGGDFLELHGAHDDLLKYPNLKRLS